MPETQDQTSNPSNNQDDLPRPSFAEFMANREKIDFEDSYKMREMLEDQANLLGSAFEYLMQQGDFRNLTSILRLQKTMCNTMELMNQYPTLSWQKQFSSTSPASPTDDPS